MMSARNAEFWGPGIIFFSLTHATDFAVKEDLLALYMQQKLSVSSNEEATVGMVKRMVSVTINTKYFFCTNWSLKKKNTCDG